MEVVNLVLYFFSSEAVCSKMELTEFSSNSPLSKILMRCFVIAGLWTPNKSAILSWVSQIFSLWKKTFTLISPLGDVYNRNSASSFVATSLVILCLLVEPLYKPYPHLTSVYWLCSPVGSECE